MKTKYWALGYCAVAVYVLVTSGIAFEWDLYYLGLILGGIVLVGVFLYVGIFIRYRKGISHNRNPFK